MTGYDLRIIKRMDKCTSLLDATAEGFFAGFVIAGAVQDDLCAVAAGGGHLNLWSGKRHNDLGADAAGGGVKGYTLGVVAGARGDDPAFALNLAKGEELIEGAALLE